MSPLPSPDADAPAGPPARSRLSAAVRTPFAKARIRRRGLFAEMRQLSRDVDAAVSASVDRRPGAPRVLVVQLKTGAVLAGYSAVFAQALRLRGADVAVLTCGGGQPACEVGWPRRNYPFPCNRCSYFTDTWAKAQGVRQYRLRDSMPWGANARRAPDEVPAPRPDGVDYVEATKVSVPRFFLAAEHHGLPLSGNVTRDFAMAAHGVEQAMEPILDEFAPDVVVLYNGLTTSEVVVKEMAEKRGARVVSYTSGFIPGRLIFSQDDPAERMESDAAWAAVGDRPLTEDQFALINRYLSDRSAGRGTYERYYKAPRDQDLLDELGLAGYERVATLFTNITWDTGCLDRDVGFESMRAWVIECIDAMRSHPGTALIVRIHPEEDSWGSRELIGEAVGAAFGDLPENVRVILPGQSINSYALMDSSDVVLTYTSTTGIEAVVRGIPVAVCGQAHYRGKGFTIDVAGLDHLHEVLGGDAAVDERQIELAWRYAFTFFFRMCIPFPAVRETDPGVVDALASVPTATAEVTPGADPYLDFVCERMLSGGQFLLPEELVAPAAL
jgi:hypothetical protein